MNLGAILNGFFGILDWSIFSMPWFLWYVILGGVVALLVTCSSARHGHFHGATIWLGGFFSVFTLMYMHSFKPGQAEYGYMIINTCEYTTNEYGNPVKIFDLLDMSTWSLMFTIICWIFAALLVYCIVYSVIRGPQQILFLLGYIVGCIALTMVVHLIGGITFLTGLSYSMFQIVAMAFMFLGWLAIPLTKD